MPRNRLALAGLVPVVLGVAAALLLAPTKVQAARRQCEQNICVTSTGNCDVTDVQGIACKEKSGDPGCESYPCPAN